MDKRLEKAHTIIFDIGNVLIQFDMERLANKMLPKRLVKYTREQFFKDNWEKLDFGSATSIEVASIVCNHFNLKGDEKHFINLMDNFCEYCTTLPPTKWMKTLKEQGKKIYLLTNYGDKSFDITKKRFDFFKYADGEVVSAKVKLCKPDKNIYLTLLNKYSIDSKHTVFLDDCIENIKAANELGITGIVYPSGIIN